MNAQPPFSYFQQLSTYLQWQSRKIQELESRIEKLESDLDSMKKQRTMTVERIEYKFDQLKIERLDGTLHIGVSPDVGKSIEDFAVDGVDPTQDGKAADNEMERRIQTRMDHYLSDECPGLIRELESRNGILLGTEYRSFIVRDIKGQMEQRIRHYLTADMRGGDSPNPEEALAREDRIVERIKADVRAAVERHLQQKKRKGDGTP